MNLNEIRDTVHKANAKWWQDINTGEDHTHEARKIDGGKQF